jgi:hypothetical protein
VRALFLRACLLVCSLALTSFQRDLFLNNRDVAPDLAHALKRAPVRSGKLGVRVSSRELDTLILATAQICSPDRRVQRELDMLVRYLERMEDSFEPRHED